MTNKLPDSLSVLLSGSQLGSLSGIVVHGQKEGRKLGFPTLNVDLDQRSTGRTEKGLQVDPGVYLCFVTIVDFKEDQPGDLIGKVNPDRFALVGNLYAGLLHFGPRSTYGETKNLWEIHLLSFDAEVYDYKVKFWVADKLRETKKFDSVQNLIDQMNADKNMAESLLDEKYKLVSS